MKKIIFVGCLILLTLAPEGSGHSSEANRSPFVVERCVGEHKASLAYAYESLFKTHANWPEVKASVEFTVTAEGNVEDVEILGTEGFDTLPQGPALSAMFADTITEAAYTWKFPPVHAGVTTVEMPFLFVPVEEGEDEGEEIKGTETPSCGMPDYNSINIERTSKGVYKYEERIIKCRRERAIPFEIPWAIPEGDIFARAAKGEDEKPAREYLKDVGKYFKERRNPPTARLNKKLASREHERGEVEAAVVEEELYLAVADLGLSDEYDWDVKRPNPKKAAKLREKQGRLSAETEKLKEEIGLNEETWSRALAEKRAALITRGEELFDNPPPAGASAWLAFALAELYLESAEGEKASALFEQVVETGEFEDKAEALYGIGYAYLLLDGGEKGPKAFYRLTQDYPESRHAAEAYFQLGEFFTYQLEPNKAEKYFLLASQTDDEYGDAALYLAAWGYYDCSSPFGTPYYDLAVSAFKRFLDAAEEGSEYWDHAIKMTGVCLAEWEPGTAERPAPVDALIRYEEAFGGAEEMPYSADVLRSLGDAYLYKMDKLPEAAATYEKLFVNYRAYEQAPAVAESLVESHLRRSAWDDAHNVRLRIADEYGPASGWYRTQNERRRCKAILEWENALYEVGVYYNMQAERKYRKNRDEAVTLFENAINRYNQYLASFPTNEKAYHINFYLAEVYFALEDYETAAQQYIKTATYYADRERYKIDKWDEKFTQEGSFFNAVVSYDEIFQKEVDEKEIERDAAISPRQVTPKPLTRAEANLVEACTEFIARYPESEEAPTILSKTGEVYFRAWDFEKARHYYLKLVEETPGPVEGRYKKEYDTLYVHALISIAVTYLKEAEALVEAGDANAGGEKRADYQAWYERAKAEAEKRNVDFEGIMEDLE
jgi:TolA-binding protein